MNCKCPVCEKKNSTVEALAEHVANSQDDSHQIWIEAYCNKKKLDFARMLLQTLNGKKDAHKPLIAPFERDFYGK